MTGKLRQLSNEREDDKLNEWMTSSHIQSENSAKDVAKAANKRYSEVFAGSTIAND